MSQYSMDNMSSWDRNQVKYWLQIKGISIEIQNRFYEEAIDGEALLYLREKDINLLTENTSTPFGTTRKLQTYIQQIQSLNNHKSNLFSSPTHSVIPVHITNLHHSPSISLQHDNHLHSSSMSQSPFTFSSSPSILNRNNNNNHLLMNASSPCSNHAYLPQIARSQNTPNLILSTPSISFPTPPTIISNPSASFSTFDQQSHCLSVNNIISTHDEQLQSMNNNNNNNDNNSLMMNTNSLCNTNNHNQCNQNHHYYVQHVHNVNNHGESQQDQHTNTDKLNDSDSIREHNDNNNNNYNGSIQFVDIDDENNCINDLNEIEGGNTMFNVLPIIKISNIEKPIQDIECNVTNSSPRSVNPSLPSSNNNNPSGLGMDESMITPNTEGNTHRINNDINIPIKREQSPMIFVSNKQTLEMQQQHQMTETSNNVSPSMMMNQESMNNDINTEEHTLSCDNNNDIPLKTEESMLFTSNNEIINEQQQEMIDSMEPIINDDNIEEKTQSIWMNNDIAIKAEISNLFESNNASKPTVESSLEPMPNDSNDMIEPVLFDNDQCNIGANIDDAEINDISNRSQQSLSPITVKREYSRNRKRKRLIIDDDSSEEDEDIASNLYNNRPLKRPRFNTKTRNTKMNINQFVSTQNMDEMSDDLIVSDSEDDIIMTQQQIESGRFAIKSAYNPYATIQQIRSKQIIENTKMLRRSSSISPSKHTTSIKTEQIEKEQNDIISDSKQEQNSPSKLRSMKISKEKRIGNNKHKKRKKKKRKKKKKRNKKELEMDIECMDDNNNNNNDIKKERKRREEPYKYSKENPHDTSNHGKRWTPTELKMIWNLHYDKGWTNMQIAEKFKRTNCGIMVQLDKMYKDKREREDLVCKKYLYEKRLNEIKNGERKWCKQERKWIKIENGKNDNVKMEHVEMENVKKEHVKMENVENESDNDCDSDSESNDESSSDEDDDEPIGLRIAREKRENEWNTKCENKLDIQQTELLHLL